jgi:catechol 2,3-dioxygenase-like lactoylglutathione lyase family enzyme
VPEPTHPIRPAEPRWTHVALRVGDIDASIEWYQRMTPLVLLDRRSDEFGHGAWLGQPDTADKPFILVLAEFFPESDPYRDSPLGTLTPFAHLGIELPERADVDEMARRGDADGSLALPATDLPPPVGYICMLRDPDGNLVEFSHDQGVYAKAREVWGG